MCRRGLLWSSLQLGIIYVPVDQHFMQACLNDGGDQSTVVSSDSLSMLKLQRHLSSNPLPPTSIPFESILSYFSGRVQYNPAYLFLLINKYGK